MFIFSWRLLQMHSLAKHIVMTDKSSFSFSVFIGVAVKHVTKSDGIKHLSSTKLLTIMCVCVCVCVCVLMQVASFYRHIIHWC